MACGMLIYSIEVWLRLKYISSKLKKKKNISDLLSKEGGVVPSGDVGVVGVGVVGVAAMSISGWLCWKTHMQCY